MRNAPLRRAYDLIVSEMTDQERYLSEIEQILLDLSDAKRRATKARETLVREGAPERFVAALSVTEQTIDAERRRLMQSTYYSVPGDQDRLAV